MVAGFTRLMCPEMEGTWQWGALQPTRLVVGHCDDELLTCDSPKLAKAPVVTHMLQDLRANHGIEGLPLKRKSRELPCFNSTAGSTALALFNRS